MEAALNQEISEIRVCELDKAIEFTKSHGGQFRPERIRANLSLIVHSDQNILATVLAIEDGKDGISLQVTVSKDITDTALLKTLVDKALLKLRAGGIAKTNIHFQGDPEGAEFWPKVEWLHDLFKSEAA